MYYAQTENNIVVAVVETSGIITKPNCIQINTLNNGLLGKKYENGQFVDVPQVLPKYCTILDFRSKFTTEEKVAIYTAANSNVLIKIWLDDLNAVQNNIVNLEDPRTIVGVQGLELAGIIASGRSNEILEM
jgi:hypothetical protein